MLTIILAQQTTDWPDVLRVWGTFVIAAIALLQPWIIAAWKKFVRRGAVEVFETARIEVGLGNFGPTVTLSGTVRAIHQDVFIQEMYLQVRRERDSSQHTLKWMVFRSPSFDNSGKSVSVELASGFLLSTQQPRVLTTVFSDLETRSLMQAIVQPVSDEWLKLVAEFFKSAEAHPNKLELPSKWAEASRSLYEQFSPRKVHVDSFTALDRLFYWEEGWYSLTLVIRTSRPDQQFETQFRMYLSANDSNALRMNNLRILSAICEQGEPNWVYANVVYHPPA